MSILDFTNLEKRNIMNEQVSEWNSIINLPELLLSLGEDLSREGLEETPRRVRKAYEELFEGYTLNLDDIMKATFDSEGGGMQVVNDIFFTSMCEHHILPFYGYVDVAYRADERVLGLSKLSRLVDYYAKRLQIQERLTNQIAQALMDYLAPKGVCVIIRAVHLCCKGRGVRRDKMYFTTQAERGNINGLPHMLSIQRREAL